MYTRGKREKRIVDDPQIRSTPSLLAIEIENPPQENPKISPVGEESPDHSANLLCMVSQITLILKWRDPF